jgi:3-oxoacyl-[acyl-carrier-protein] synthase II
MRKEKRIVITGIGTVSPCGMGKEKFWNCLKNGRSAIKPIAGFDTNGIRCKQGGEIRRFSVKHLLGAKGLRELSRSTQFALAGAKFAFDDAKLKFPVPEKTTDSCGVVLGVATGSTPSLMELDREIVVKGPRFISPLALPNGGPNATASQISITFNIKGFNATVASSFASGLDAIFYACNMIRNYGYKVVLTGGVEELGREVIAALIKAKCLAGSKSRGDKEISCPYDRRRNGIVASEGAAVMIVEDMEHAKKRKAKIYAEIKGQGFSFAAETRRGFNTTKKGASEAMRQALMEFGYPDKKIDYIAGCANSTRDCDYAEAQAIKLVFKEKAKEVPVSSVKSIIGESLSAGGSFNIAAAIGALENNIIPPTINYRVSDKRCDLNIVSNKARKQKIGNVLINAFGLSGFNSALVIGREER